MNIQDQFRFCPRCGAAGLEQKALRFFHCAACDFQFYLNAATAAGGIILNDEGRALLARRAHEPGLGKLGLPGGFVDDGESVEDTVRREVREEVHLEIENLRFFGSFSNRYEFRGCAYSVMDLIFLCEAVNPANASNSEEVSETLWLLPSEINLDEVAFPSVRRALEMFIQKSM